MAVLLLRLQHTWRFTPLAYKRSSSFTLSLKLTLTLLLLLLLLLLRLDSALSTQPSARATTLLIAAAVCLLTPPERRHLHSAALVRGTAPSPRASRSFLLVSSTHSRLRTCSSSSSSSSSSDSLRLAFA